MITLHFNPQYDSGAWSGEPGKGVAWFSEIHVGPSGLLGFLEVRLGITAREKPGHELLADFTKAAQAVAAKNKDVFFAQSLKLAPLATANELLRWRDELVLSGWEADTPVPEGLTSGARSILRGLSEVESALPGGFRTTADRWRILLATLKTETALGGFSVKVHAPENHMHPVHLTVLDQLRRCGVPVDNVVVMREPDVEIKHFHDSSDACLWAAAHEGHALLVCSDDQTLSSAQAAFGDPYGNATASATPRPVAHLFTSAMLLLKDAEDIIAFQDYLSAPSHPLNKFTKPGNDKLTLREALLKHVVRRHGFEGIDGIVDSFANGDKECLEKIKKWIPEPGQPLNYGRIKDWCNRLKEWADGAVRMVGNKGEDSPYLDQWRELASACDEMKFQCKELDIDNHPETFFSVLRAVSEPDAAIARHAVIGSAPAVASIEKIAVDVQDVIWVDGSFTAAPTPLSFLCPNDIQELKRILPNVWLHEDALLLTDELFQAGLAHIGGKLTILYCDAFAGEKREKHPFILRRAGSVDYLKSLPFEPIPATKAEPCPSRPVGQIPEECTLTVDGLSLPEHESPTSLENLFGQPLDWVLKYILGLWEEVDTNDSLIKGLVAHDVIHRICEKAGRTGIDAEAFEQVFQSDFDSFFAAAVLANGAELNLPENKLDREQFKYDLHEVSLPKLIEILRNSHLTIFGSEVKIENVEILKKDISDPKYEPLRITGSIDLLLKNETGHYVILDFKWTGKNGRNMRTDQIKKGEDYQLALYRKLAETGAKNIPAGTVDAQAFFLLKTGELLTAYPGFRNRNGDIPIVEPGARTKQKTYEETLDEIYRKYTDTVRDFRAGKVSAGNLKDQYLGYKVLKGKLS
jgi:hypothetical protein